ncbi:MAG: TPM domain-containing protein [Burkholderiales bacterium]
MHWQRAIRHLLTDHWSVRRAFPPATMRAIRDRIGEQETRHSGQLRFAVEASLPFFHLWRGQDARSRAVELFGQLRVWDTQHNNGVLVYLLLADRRVEIVADRGIHDKVGATAWEAICGEMQRAFAAGRFEQGASLGIAAISDLLATHFPRSEGDTDELPNEAVVL